MADITKYSANSGDYTWDTSRRAHGVELAAVAFPRLFTGIAARIDSGRWNYTYVVRVWTQAVAHGNGVAEVYYNPTPVKTTNVTINGIASCILLNGFSFQLNANQRYLVCLHIFDASLSYSIHLYNAGDFAADEDHFQASPSTNIFDGILSSFQDGKAIRAVYLSTIEESLTNESRNRIIPTRYVNVIGGI